MRDSVGFAVSSRIAPDASDLRKKPSSPFSASGDSENTKGFPNRSSPHLVAKMSSRKSHPGNPVRHDSCLPEGRQLGLGQPPPSTETGKTLSD